MSSLGTVHFYTYLTERASQMVEMQMARTL